MLRLYLLSLGARKCTCRNELLSFAKPGGWRSCTYAPPLNLLEKKKITFPVTSLLRNQNIYSQVGFSTLKYTAHMDVSAWRKKKIVNRIRINFKNIEPFPNSQGVNIKKKKIQGVFLYSISQCFQMYALKMGGGGT